MDVSFNRPKDEELETLTAKLKEEHEEIFGFSFGDEEFLIYRGLTRGDMKKILDEIDAEIKNQLPDEAQTGEEPSLEVQQQTLFLYQQLETEFVIRHGVVWPDVSGVSGDSFDKLFKIGIYDRLHGAIKEASAFDSEVSIKKL